jgi:hypothetical protein
MNPQDQREAEQRSVKLRAKRRRKEGITLLKVMHWLAATIARVDRQKLARSKDFPTPFAKAII